MTIHPLWSLFISDRHDGLLAGLERLLQENPQDPDALAATAVLLRQAAAPEAEIEEFAVQAVVHNGVGPANLAAGWALGRDLRALYVMLRGVLETPAALALALCERFATFSPPHLSQTLARALIAAKTCGLDAPEGAKDLRAVFDTVSSNDIETIKSAAETLRQLGAADLSCLLLNLAAQRFKEHRLSLYLLLCLYYRHAGRHQELEQLCRFSDAAGLSAACFRHHRVLALIGLLRMDDADRLVEEIDAEQRKEATRRPELQAELLLRANAFEGFSLWRRRMERLSPGWSAAQDAASYAPAAAAAPATPGALVYALHRPRDADVPLLPLVIGRALALGCAQVLIGIDPADAETPTTLSALFPPHSLAFTPVTQTDDNDRDAALIRHARDALRADWVILGAPDLLPHGPHGGATAALAQALDPTQGGDPEAGRIFSPCFAAQNRADGADIDLLEVQAQPWPRRETRKEWPHSPIAPWVAPPPLRWARCDAFVGFDGDGEVLSARPRLALATGLQGLQLMTAWRRTTPPQYPGWTEAAETLNQWMRAQGRLIQFRSGPL